MGTTAMDCVNGRLNIYPKTTFSFHIKNRKATIPFFDLLLVYRGDAARACFLGGGPSPTFATKTQSIDALPCYGHVTGR